jgi:putative MATE family efflux protein
MTLKGLISLNRARKGFAGEFRHRFIELFRLSAPIIIEQVFITVMGLTNTAMVSSSGSYAVSAAGMVDSVSNLIIAAFAALTTGGAIVVAQHMGKGDRRGAAVAAAQSAVLSIVISLFIFAVFAAFRESILGGLFGAADADVLEAGNTYFKIVNFSFPILAVTQTIFGALRGSGDTGAPMAITLAMNAFNFLFGWILIYGVNIFGVQIHGHGIAGAASAITLARLAGMLIAIWYIVKKSKTIRLNHFSYFKLDFKMQRIILGLGIPTSIESVLFQVGKIITQLFIVGMGTAALAANAVASNIFSFINVPGTAFSTGVMILIGQKTGRGQFTDVPKTTVFAVIAGVFIMGALCLACYPSIGLLAGIYNLDADAASAFRSILISGIIATPLLWSQSFIIPASLRAAGDVTFTMITAIASMWIFRIASGYFVGVALGFGVVGVWVGMYVDWLVRGVIFFCRIMFTKKWQKRIFASDS